MAKVRGKGELTSNLGHIPQALITMSVALFCGSGEMADTQVLGTCVFGRAGSSPASRTIYISAHKPRKSP